jgi:hypothetical protein
MLTEMGTYLTKANPGNLIGYTALEKEDPGVLQMVSWLQHDGPENATQGVSFVKDELAPSPMDDPQSAVFFTMALAGRARYLAPVVAHKIKGRKGHLLDIAAGTGYYTFEWLLANPETTATLLDRPEVLKVAEGLLHEFCKSHKGTEDLKERIQFLPCDMLKDDLPQADIIFAFSLFHDWPEATCATLARKFAGALKPGGELWVHDAFLNDALDGPLAVTDYSALLFLGTRGRAYSRKEYRQWFLEAGLAPHPDEIPTLMDYGLISASKDI